MSESENCVEPREEEPTEPEEAGGAEVKMFLIKGGIVSSRCRVHLPQSYQTKV